jgi:hypothetical protein
MVGTPTHYGLGGPGAGIPAGPRDFPLSRNRPDRLWGPFVLIFSGYRGPLLAVERPEREVDHLSLSSAEVKNEWSYLLLSAPALRLTKSLALLQKFPPLYSIYGRCPPAPYSQHICLLSHSVSALARGLPTFLSPLGRIYIRLLGIQISSILAVWPAHRIVAVLITANCLGSLKRS